MRIPLVDQTRPYLERLEAELDEDIFLGICIGHQLLILDQIESSKELKMRARPGTRISVFAGAAGKIFLANDDPQAVSRRIRSQPLPKFTPDSITDADRYMADLDKVRAEGVAWDIGEYLPNVWAVAVPIFYGKKTRKRMVAGFWVVGLDSKSSAAEDTDSNDSWSSDR